MDADSGVSERRPIVRIWVVIGVLVSAIAVPLWGPLSLAWRCYWLHENGQRAQAELVHKLQGDTLVLRRADGSQAGNSCTARTSSAIHAAAEPGQTFEVVYFGERPGDCVLASTMGASRIVLFAIIGGLAGLLLLLVGVGVWLQKSFSRPAAPRRRMRVVPDSVRCPSCGGAMDEGYLPLLAGTHWRRLGEPIGLPHALGGLPGTVGWRGRPLVHAFRCAGCEILTFQYGTDPTQQS
jgi:hypothetical protein